MAVSQRGEITDSQGHTQAQAVPAKEQDAQTADGSAVYIPLLQRCKAHISCQAARFPQADLPQIKLQLGVRRLLASTAASHGWRCSSPC